MGKYFDRFPLVNYDGVPAKNLLSKVDFTNDAKRDIYSNFDMVLQEGMERADVLSYTYYNSSYYDWLIYLSNNTIDPYCDVYRAQDDFEQFIDKKYGSASIARNTILFYRNDWASDDRIISTSAYEALTTDETVDLRKYWKPKLNNLGGIVGYERLQEDWTISTNKILEITLTVEPTFAVGDTLYQQSTGALGQVVNVDTTNYILTVQHIRSGEFVVNTEEGISTVSLINKAISDSEAAYWAPVSAYDFEAEQNELKKHVNLIKSSYLPDVEKLFIEKIK